MPFHVIKLQSILIFRNCFTFLVPKVRNPESFGGCEILENGAEAVADIMAEFLLLQPIAYSL
jgi:hypothetical protein